MLRTLLETKKRSPRRRIAMTASAVAHALLCAMLVMGRGERTAQASEPEQTRVVYFAPKEAQTQIERADRGVPSPVSPIREPFTLPPIAPALERSIRELPAAIVASERDPFLPIGRVAGRDSLPATDIEPSDVLTERTVDQPVEILPNQRPPRYPILLERAGVGGDVVAQFVVDTLGRVERNSVAIQHASHAEFGRAVQERVAGLRFVPARARGRVVRQLVQQRFTFEVVRP